MKPLTVTVCAIAIVVGLAADSTAEAPRSTTDPAVVTFGHSPLPVIDAADTLRLGLGGAITMVLNVSEEVRIAESDLARARSLVTQSRSQVLPQLNAGLSYARQFASVFEGESGAEFPPFEPDTLAPLEDRVRYLEENTPTAALSGLSDLFGDLPFGREHSWVASLGLSQKVYKGGALLGAIRAAEHVRAAADEALASAKTDLVQAVMESYLGALLADRLVSIAEIGLGQATQQYELVSLHHQVGRASDFDLLQAEVQRDNQRPLLVEAENARSLAYLSLRRLINLSPNKPLVLTDTLLADSTPIPDIASLDREQLALEAESRPAIRTVEEAVAAREQGVNVARSGWLPEVSLFANYSQQAYPGDVVPGGGDWVDDFAVGLRLDLALFDGFLTSGRVSEAKAQLQSEAQRLAILREERRLAVEQRSGELERARADLMSRQQTVRFAARAHDLARLRYDEGAANLFDVADVRVTELLARINEARARYDMMVALARLEKLTGRPFLTSQIVPGGVVDVPVEPGEEK